MRCSVFQAWAASRAQLGKVPLKELQRSLHRWKTRSTLQRNFSRSAVVMGPRYSAWHRQLQSTHHRPQRVCEQQLRSPCSSSPLPFHTLPSTDLSSQPSPAEQKEAKPFPPCHQAYPSLPSYTASLPPAFSSNPLKNPPLPPARGPSDPWQGRKAACTWAGTRTLLSDPARWHRQLLFHTTSIYLAFLKINFSEKSNSKVITLRFQIQIQSRKHHVGKQERI